MFIFLTIYAGIPPESRRINLFCTLGSNGVNIESVCGIRVAMCMLVSYIYYALSKVAPVGKILKSITINSAAFAG